MPSTAPEVILFNVFSTLVAMKMTDRRRAFTEAEALLYEEVCNALKSFVNSIANCLDEMKMKSLLESGGGGN